MIDWLKNLWHPKCRLCDEPRKRWFPDTIHLGDQEGIEKIRICKKCSDILAAIKNKTDEYRHE